ncbi:hypothetical protein Mgra_00009988 [Meloidogyne graminicola]|uniref:Uncharacterized protein n=1 Tax=Meloidogyne graminicola TaxID=189291 RepID=A0A8S9Z6E0_9BILA|nr:hypothetical protein Mgra_00009988 [Meloidogyne graminicola]
MKSIIFNNNNNNGYWKKQAMLVNMLALSIIVLLLMIEQVNTKEVDISTKDTKIEEEGKLENLAAAENLAYRHPDPEYHRKMVKVYVLSIINQLIMIAMAIGCTYALYQFFKKSWQ